MRRQSNCKKDFHKFSWWQPLQMCGPVDLVHWIDEVTLQRKKGVLACKRLKGSHTYNILAGLMSEIHWNYHIENKVTKTTTDNGSNFVKAFNVFGVLESNNDDDEVNECKVSDEVTEEDHVVVEEITSILKVGRGEEVDEDIGTALPKHGRCAAHTLNLVATVDADKALGKCCIYKKLYRSAFAKAQNLWNKQSRSSKVADEIQSEVGILLKVPTITRWNSVFDAVARLLTVFNSREKHDGLQRACNNLGLIAFTKSDVAFLKEYHLVMRPICQSLDILQSEEKAYMGILLPTLCMTRKRLQELRDSNKVAVCLPLLTRLLESLENRFGHVFDDSDCQLAAAFHPQFRLSWLSCLDKGEEIKTSLHLKMVNLLQNHSNFNIDGAANSSDTDVDSHETDDFFAPLFENTKKKEASAAKIVNDFFERNPTKTITCDAFPNDAMRCLFLRYNTPIPSSAAVERLFSLGKDILKPKRAGLSDQHFEMLMFLKGN